MKTACADTLASRLGTPPASPAARLVCRGGAESAGETGIRGGASGGKLSGSTMGPSGSGWGATGGEADAAPAACALRVADNSAKKRTAQVKCFIGGVVYRFSTSRGREPLG